MKNAKLLLLVLLILLSSPIAFSYSPDVPHPVHQYITNESGKVWKLIPYEIKEQLSNSIDTPISDVDLNPNSASIFSSELDYQSGDDIVDGSGEEDVPPNKVLLHLWNPDTPNGGLYGDGWGFYPSAYNKALILWKYNAIPAYLKGDTDRAYYWLGRISHLLEDQTVPAHAHNDGHPPFVPGQKDLYESNANSIYTNYSGEIYEGEQYNYDDLPNTDAELWSEVDADDKDHIELFRLFWFTAQRAQYFASDDRDWKDYYVNLFGNQKTLKGGEI